MKKALAIVVALMMVMALIPVTAGAQNVQPFKGRLSSTDVASRSVATREATRDIFNDGSLLFTSFEDDEDPLWYNQGDGWWMYDADGDDNNWGWYGGASAAYAYDGSNFLLDYSYDGDTGDALDADDWLVTCPITIPSTGEYSVSVYANSLTSTGNYPDHLQILVGEDGEAYDDTSIYPDAWVSIMDRTTVPAGGQGVYTQYTASLADFAGMTVSIAFRHTDNDQVALLLDYVQVGIEGEAVNETAITLDQNTLALDVTASGLLTATIAPDDASYKDVTWTTSDPTVAAVNKMGGVIGLAAGTATITATSHNGLTATCVVTVSEGENSFATPLVTFGIYDGDAEEGAENPNNWYTVDQYGAMELLAEDGENYLVRPTWHAGNELIYAYVNNSTDSASSYDFVSIDPNTMEVTTIAAGLTEAPWWMSYGWDTNEMYGGFISFDEDDNIAGFNFSTIDLATGLEDEVLVDVYNATYTDSNNEEQQYGFLPLHTTYAGGGYFIGADYQYNDLLMYVPDYNGQGFAAGFVSDYDLTAQYASVPTYIEAIYYNPFDGMLYWACPASHCDMVIVDLENGIAVPTGVTGLEGASFGIELSGMFQMYTLTNTYVVEFYDGLTGELIASVEVEEGGAAEAPAAPEHEGYTFIGWDADFSNVTEDMVVYAQYEENAPTGLLGDADCNDEVNFADVSVMSLFCSGQGDLTAQGQINGDMDYSGAVTFSDISMLYLHLLGQD